MKIMTFFETSHFTERRGRESVRSSALESYGSRWKNNFWKRLQEVKFMRGSTFKRNTLNGNENRHDVGEKIKILVSDLRQLRSYGIQGVFSALTLMIPFCRTM
jgi:hypothetical protein